MRQFVVDELRPEEVDEMEGVISSQCERAGLGRLYWLDIPDDLLTPVQSEHKEACGPFSAAIELRDRKVVFELLVRSRQNLKCACIGYAKGEQREYILRFADMVLDRCGIKA